MNKDINYVKLNPGWITGFSDGEASFSVSVSYNESSSTNYKFIPAFAIELKDTDLDLLYRIQDFFKGVGKIYLIKNKGHAVYVVSKIYDLQNVIIPHFVNYPLLTIKRITFLFFKQIICLMSNKEHLTIEGTNAIINSRLYMNKVVTVEDLKGKIIHLPVKFSEINTLKVSNITNDWFVGFTDAEGCFFLNVRPNKNNTNFWVTHLFSLTQHSRDTLLFNLFKEFLRGGFIHIEKNKDVVRYRTEKLSFIVNTIIPFFEINPLQSRKKKEFLDFSLACKLKNDKLHLTKEGLTKIRIIKSNMNTKRTH